MGRKRINELKAGGQTTLYVPQDIDPKVLSYLNEQSNISKALLELAYDHVYNKYSSNIITENLDSHNITIDKIQNIVNDLVDKKLNQMNVYNRSNDSKKSIAIKNLNFGSD